MNEAFVVQGRQDSNLQPPVLETEHIWLSELVSAMAQHPAPQ